MGKESKKEIFVYGDDRRYFQLKHAGFYDIKAMINGLMGKLREFDYIITDKNHTEAIKASGKEAKFEWSCFREVNDYIKFKIFILIEIRREIDVVMDKKKMQKGNIEFRLQASFEKNYKKTFKTKGLGEFQRHAYEKFIIKPRLEEYEDRVKEEGTQLINIAKEHIL